MALPPGWHLPVVALRSPALSPGRPGELGGAAAPSGGRDWDTPLAFSRTGAPGWGKRSETAESHPAAPVFLPRTSPDVSSAGGNTARCAAPGRGVELGDLCGLLQPTPLRDG